MRADVIRLDGVHRDAHIFARQCARHEGDQRADTADTLAVGQQVVYVEGVICEIGRRFSRGVVRQGS